MQSTSQPRLFGTTGRFVLTLTLLWLLVFTWYHFASAHDPTSYFFDKRTGYERKYTAQRLREADAFIKASQDGAPGHSSSKETPYICVGVATVRRRGDQYVRSTIGSLLEGLEPEEREQVQLQVLVGHTDPTQHPFSSERWLQASADRLLSYSQRPEDIESVKAWEAGGWYRNKTIYDYTYVMQSCYDSGARYILMIEDDTLAVKTWYRRLIQDVATVEARMQPRKPQQWVYLRLFFTDDLLGWNSEDWVRYLFWSFVTWSIVMVVIQIANRPTKYHPGRLSKTSLAFLSCVFIPACIGLHFMAGRHTMWPFPSGVHELNKYGCCSQALVYPRQIVPGLLAQADLTTDWLVDMMIEKISDANGWIRWATIPATFQHIGSTSSKGYGFDDSARALWNFGFEDYRITS